MLAWDVPMVTDHQEKVAAAVVALKLSSRGETALITGDCIHHPVQCSGA
ncbi:hypothetical protein ABZW44_25655 [Streptomyces mirabilis]